MSSDMHARIGIRFEQRCSEAEWTQKCQDVPIRLTGLQYLDWKMHRGARSPANVAVRHRSKRRSPRGRPVWEDVEGIWPTAFSLQTLHQPALHAQGTSRTSDGACKC